MKFRIARTVRWTIALAAYTLLLAAVTVTVLTFLRRERVFRASPVDEGVSVTVLKKEELRRLVQEIVAPARTPVPAQSPPPATPVPKPTS